MDSVKFYKDPNCSDSFNGVAVFTKRPLKGKDKAGKMKTGWEALVPQTDGAGDGPYAADKISKAYLGELCTEISEDEARKIFPALVALVKDSKELWS